MRKKNKGVLTVEATLAFPVYIIAILTIVSFLNIFYTHAVVQQALNNTALRIAEYSYALKVTNCLDYFERADKANQKVTDYQTKVNNLTTSAQKTMQSFSNGFTIATLPDIISNAEEFGTSLNDLATSLASETTKSIGELAIGLCIGAGTDVAGDAIVKRLTEDYLREMKLDQSNIKNMDFSMSRFYYGKNQDVTLVVTYEYQNPLGIKFFDSVKMIQTCTVHPWIGSKG